MENNLDRIRQDVMDRVDSNRRYTTMWVVFAAIMEGTCLVAYLLLMDFGERLHWLILVAGFLVYGTLAFGLLALGTYSQHWNLRLMQAIELSSRQRSSDEANPVP